MKTIVKILLLASLTGFTISISAQSISGNVMSLDNSPISFATVVASSDSAGMLIKGFALTDDKGNYSIDHNSSGALWIITRCMGYSTSYVKTVVSANADTRQDIALVPDNVALDDVIVKATATGRYIKGDTVSYNPKVFALGNEKTLADMLRRLPGISVDNTGNVSYQGKLVDKILVNGKDIFATNGAMAVNTLPASYANGIEIITDYKENTVLDKASTRRKTAMNIKSDDQKRCYSSARLEYGYKNRRELAFNSIYTGEKASIATTVNHNNTGKIVFAPIDYLNMIGGMSSLEERITSDEFSIYVEESVTTAMMKQNDEYERESTLASVSATIKPNDTYKMSVSAMGLLTDYQTFARLDKLYNNGTLSVDTLAGTNKSPLGIVGIYNSWNIDNKMTVQLRTTAVAAHNDDKARGKNVFNTSDIERSTHNETQTYDFTQTADWGMCMGENILAAGVRFGYTSTDIESKILSNRWLIDNSYAQYSDDRYSYRNTEDNTRLSVSADAGFSSALIANEMDLRISLQYEHVNTNEKKNELSSIVGQRLLTNALKAYGAVYYYANGFNITLGCYATNINVHHKSIGDYSIVRPEPRAIISFRKSATSIELNADHKYEAYELMHVYSAPNIESDISMRKASEVTKPISNITTASLSFKHMGKKDNSTINLSADYSKERNVAVGNIEITDTICEYYSYRDGGARENASADLTLSRGVPSLPIDVRTSLSGTWSNVDVLYSGQTMTQETQSVSVNAGISTRFLSWPVNAECNYTYGYSNYIIDDLSIDTEYRSHTANATLAYKKGVFTANITGKLLHQQNDNTTLSRKDIDFSIGYSPIKKFTIELRGANVCSINKLEYISTAVSSAYTSHKHYRSVPGYVMLSLSVQL